MTKKSKKLLSQPKECDLNSNMYQSIFNNRYIQCLILLTVIGFILRFYNLGFNCLWLDEASTNTFATMSLAGIWNATIGGEFNPPLFYWVEHIIINLLQNNEVTLRLVPAIFGVLTIPAIYYVGKEFIDSNVGIISAAAFTFSPFLIFYSQEARAYSMMLFFITLSMVFYFRALKNNDTLNWCLFGLFSAIAFWTHFYALVMIASLILYAIYIHITTRKISISPFILGVSIFTILISPLIIASIKLFTSRTSTGPTFGIQGIGVFIETLKQISGFSDILMLTFGLIFIIGVIGLLFTDKDKGIFLLVITIMTFIVSIILSFKMPMVPRYLIFFNIIFFIGIASSYKLLYSKISNPKIIYGIMAILIVVSAPTLLNYYSTQTKDDWRGFSSQVQNLTVKGDVIVLVPGYLYQPFDYYYSNTSDKTLELMAINKDELESINTNYPNNTLYFVVTGDILSANPNGDAIAWLEEHTMPIGRNNNIYLFNLTRYHDV